jgi:hypothetical protein
MWRGFAVGSSQGSLSNVTAPRRFQTPLSGIFYGEVIEISDNGRSGIVIITDDEGNVLDSFSGSAAVFQASGDWQLAE